MADNFEASGSGAGGGDENQWLSMLATGDNVGMHEVDDEMEETHHQDGTDGGDEAGNETNTSGAGGDGTSSSKATRRRKARRPNQLGTTQEEFIEVDPKSGLPIAPYEFARTFGKPDRMHRMRLQQRQCREAHV